MVQVLDKFLHDDGVIYAYVENDNGDFAVISQAELDNIIFAEQIGECTCTELPDAAERGQMACPTCRAKISKEIPF